MLGTLCRTVGNIPCLAVRVPDYQSRDRGSSLSVGQFYSPLFSYMSVETSKAVGPINLVGDIKG